MVSTEAKVTTNDDLASDIRGGDAWAVVIWCRRMQPKSVSQIVKGVYGNLDLLKTPRMLKAFDAICDGFEVYSHQESETVP